MMVTFEQSLKEAQVQEKVLFWIKLLIIGPRMSNKRGKMISNMFSE